MHLKEVVDFFEDAGTLEPVVVNTREEFLGNQYEFDIDFSEVKGQENIKRAMEIAAAGGHNAILIGPPGVGQTFANNTATTEFTRSTGDHQNSQCGR